MIRYFSSALVVFGCITWFFLWRKFLFFFFFWVIRIFCYWLKKKKTKKKLAGWLDASKQFFLSRCLISTGVNGKLTEWMLSYIKIWRIFNSGAQTNPNPLFGLDLLVLIFWLVSQSSGLVPSKALSIFIFFFFSFLSLTLLVGIYNFRKTIFL